VAQFLIAKGCDVHATNITGETPLDLARQWRNGPVVRVLLSNGAATDDGGATPLHWAACSTEGKEIHDIMVVDV